MEVSLRSIIIKNQNEPLLLRREALENSGVLVLVEVSGINLELVGKNAKFWGSPATATGPKVNA